MRYKKEIIITTCIILLLSLVTFFLLIESAGEEPFLRFSARFAYTQLILSGAIIVFWLELIIFCFYRIFKKKSRVFYLIVLLWCCFALYWQVFVPRAYISDVIKFTEWRESLKK